MVISGNPTVCFSNTTKRFLTFEAAELYGPGNLLIVGPCHVAVVEMKKDGSGRGDL